MRARIRAAWPGARLAAPAFPVHCTPGDNLAVHVAVARAPVGAALAVDVGDEDELGYWGEVLTTAAESRGIAGIVIDGGVRDTSALEEHGFAVFATTVALRGATKNRPGSVGVPVAVGGVSVAAGDWLVGDADGVTGHQSAGRDGRGRAHGRPGRGPTKEAGHVQCPSRQGSDDARTFWASTPRLLPGGRRGLLAPEACASGRDEVRAASAPGQHGAHALAGHPGHLGPRGAAGAADVREQHR